MDVSLHRATRVLERHRSALLARKGVVGVAVGPLFHASGVVRQTMGIQVFVEEKLSTAELRANQAIPKEIEGVPVDVVEASFGDVVCASSASPRRRRRNPLLGGVKITPLNNPRFGTLTLMLSDGIAFYALSAEHVAGEAGTKTAQPGGSARVGTVAAASRSSQANVDAAVIALDGSARDHAAGVVGAERQLKSRTRMSTLGEEVYISGACSGSVIAEVTSVDFSARVKYHDGTSVTYRSQIGVKTKSGPLREGDSGSAVLDSDRRELIGMAIAKSGDGVGTNAVVTPIEFILGMKALQPGGKRLEPLA